MEKIKQVHDILDRAGIFKEDGTHPQVVERVKELINRLTEQKESFQALLEIWIGELVQAQNQLYPSWKTRMGKETIQYVEKAMGKVLKRLEK